MNLHRSVSKVGADVFASVLGHKKIKESIKVKHDSMNSPMAAMIAFLLAIMAAMVLGSLGLLALGCVTDTHGHEDAELTIGVAADAGVEFVAQVEGVADG